MTICLVVALKAEAEALIKAFELKICMGRESFPIWENGDIKLIISGAGKLLSSAACSYLAAIVKTVNPCGWLNIGIGGHTSHEVGTPILSHKILDQASQAHFFPSLVFTPPCQTETILTVDTPTNRYALPAVYDMEASGFFPIASKFSLVELVHVLKIISDNERHSFTSLTKEKITNLIFSKITLIQKMISEIKILIDEISHVEIPFLKQFVTRWHFTVCETDHLKKLLKKWQLLSHKSENSSLRSWLMSKNTNYVQDIFKQCPRLIQLQKGKEVLSYLEEKIENLSPEFVQ